MRSRAYRGPAQQPQHPGRGVGVQRSSRLVGEDHVRPRDQRPRDRHALLLAAGQLGRPPPQLPAAQAHPGRRQLDVRPPHPAVIQPQRQRDVLAHEPAANDSDTRSSAATAPRRRLYRFVTSLSSTGAAAAVPSSVSVGFPVSMTMLASLRAGLSRANGAARRLSGGGFPRPGTIRGET